MKSLLMRLDRPPVARGTAAVAAAALLTVAVVHLIDGPESLEDQFYVGALELALTAACVTLAIGLILRPTRDTWIASATIIVLALLLYVLSRTTGLPGAGDDVGNWGEALGVLNVASEALLLALAASALAHDDEPECADARPGGERGVALSGELQG
jgi:hypothetical protein